MKDKSLFVGFAVVLVFSLGLYALWRNYSDNLSKGMRPPESSQILNKIESEGLPAFSLKQLDGSDLSLEQFKGKIIILNFWASWCEPCVKEFPSMMTLIEKLNGEVVLLALSADYELKDMELFLKAFKVNSPNIYVAWDKDQEVAKSFGTFTLPESYIIGRDGQLIRKISGIEEWDTPDAIEYFKTL